jgi:hypothetical protein
VIGVKKKKRKEKKKKLFIHFRGGLALVEIVVHGG